MPAIEKANDEAVFVSEHPSAARIRVDGGEVTSAVGCLMFSGREGPAASFEFVAIEEDF